MEEFMKRVLQLGVVLSFSCAAPGAIAADAVADYPNRTVRFIAPFVPGGPSDLLSRMLSQKLNEAWGQSVLVDNRGSAGGIVGFELGARALPDGYTLLLATASGLVINPSVYKKLSYDPVRDYQPVSQITSAGYVMVVHPSVPAKSVPDLIALAKAKPGALNYATTGTNNLLSMELFNRMAGVKTTGISYKGTGQAVTAVVGTEVQIFIISPIVGLPHVKADRLRAVGYTGAKRTPVMPDLPTVAETLPGFEQIVWHSVVVPAKTPKPIVAKISKEIMRIMQLPDIKERLNSQGLDTVGSTPEQLAELINREIKLYAKIVKDIGFQPM